MNAVRPLPGPRARRVPRGLGPALLAFLAALLPAGSASAAEPTPVDLRDAHDPALQAALDAALLDRPGFARAVREQRASIVVADVTDLARPRVASYNGELMLYAASLPKIAIVLGALVEMDEGRLVLDEALHRDLVAMIKRSSNAAATRVLHRVGMERLTEILQDPAHGALYDRAHGGGLWVGKAYDKSPVWRRDPLHGISHGASAMQAARFYHGVLTGELVDARHLPLLAEMFGEPALHHKFAKGMEGRKGARLFRKSGTWSHFHADSGVIARDHQRYVVVAIADDPRGGPGLVEFIRRVDDVMKAEAAHAAGP